MMAQKKTIANRSCANVMAAAPMAYPSRPSTYARLRPMRSPTLLPIRMNAAETSASSAMADWTPLTVVPISRTTAEIDTFISDVSTTSTNIAIASRMASRWLLFAVSGTPVLTLWVIRALLDLLTHASCQRVCRLGLGHHPPAGDQDPDHATRAIHSDSSAGVLAGQWAGDQSPSGSVVCPTSIR